MQLYNDEELVSRFCAGNKESFTQLYTKYRQQLYGYCYRLLQDQDEAEDMVQSTFLKVYHNLGSLDKPELFYYWLFSIARNSIYTHLKSHRHNGKASLTEEEEHLVDTETPYEVMVKKEMSEILHLCLEELKVEYREVLVLRQIEKLSYSQIAAITGDTISAVESRLFKARKSLAKKLMPYYRERR
ncbi:MAG: sigma-70 family RNA polymerase sigma factor [bacterium]